MAAPRTGKVTYPYTKWGESPENLEMRRIVKLRAAIIAFESSSKELLDAASNVNSPELAQVIDHIKKQMENAQAYAKTAFQRIESLGESVYERGSMGKMNAGRRAQGFNFRDVNK